MKNSSEEDRALIERFEAAGQGHVFRYLDRLSPPEREALLAQAASIDLMLLERLKPLVAGEEEARAETLEAPEVFRPDEVDPACLREAREVGEELLREGRVAAVLVAGGQGTRLGWDAPKGTYPIGPVSDRTLFEWFAGRLLALESRAGKPVPLYVMTSETTHRPTVDYFEERDLLGLDPANVRFFEQGMLPALDLDGKLILDAPGHVFMAPNGHGGSFEGLLESGALAEMADRGIEEIFYFQVDNVLVRIADPLFMGLHRQAGAQMSSKVVEKSGPDEKVGVVARADGRLGVVEYSEMTPEQAEARDDDGRLRYGAGNIAIHAIRRDFAEFVARETDLPLHRAKKKVPFLGPDGETVDPAAPNAVKFERFVFDALPLTETSITMDVVRAEEFSPVKNPAGTDSPETARADLSALFRRCYEDLGMDIGSLAEAEFHLEIDPVVTLEEFALPDADGDPSS